MIFEGKKSRGQEVKQKTNKPSPLVGERIYGRTSETSLDCEQIEQAVAIATFAKLCERGVNSRQGRVRGYYGLPRPHFVQPRNDEATCHPAFIAGSHKKEILKRVQDDMNATIQRKIAPTLTLPHKGGDKNSFPNEGRLGWVPIKNAVAKLNNKAAFTKPSRATNEVRGELASTETLSFRCKSERWRLMRGAAFTLAEVLITLGIIGVVAAMTMPALITKYQKQVTVNKLKKAYSEINQAVKISEIKYGTMDTWDISGFATKQDQTKYFADNYLIPNIKVLKTCDITNKNECWAETIYNIDGKESSNESLNDSKTYYLITASGYSVGYWIHQTGNGGWFYIDINGPKKPNTYGKDIFVFTMTWGNSGTATTNGEIYKPGFYASPLQSLDEEITRDTIKSGCIKAETRSSGVYCAALIMYDGWQIKDDYPW